MKRSLRDYLLTLTLAVVIFAVVAVFLIQAAEGLMEDVVTKIGSEGETEETVTQEEPKTEEVPVQGENVTPEDVSATFLLLGLDHKKEHVDSIFLVGINATKKQATVALIPSNTSVTEGGAKQNLGDNFSSRSIHFYKEFVEKETGIMPDYYGVIPMSAISNLVDLYGGISYSVPQNMQSMDPDNKVKIDLKAGKQTLNGSQVFQLLSYTGYSGRAAKEDTQLGFVRAFCTSFFTPANLSRASAIHNNMYYNCQTDFEAEDLKELGEMIFNLSTYTQNYTRIPGAASGSYYAISTAKAKAMFEVYQ